MHPQISILILNYNGKKFNQACLESVLTQTYQHFEILFIDNASSDGSVEEVEQRFAKEIKSGKIRIIRNKKNEGFANGNNIGHKLADKNSKYICLLNNDTTVKPNRLGELMKIIENDKTLGAVGSFVLDKGKEDSIQNLFLVEKKKYINNYILETSFTAITNQELETGVIGVTGLTGCCFLYRKELIQEPFPSFYFAYAEDTYLSQLITLKGYKLAICLTSKVYHFGSGSFGKKTSLLKAFHGTKNSLCNIFIFHTRANIIKLLPIFFLYQLMKIIKSDAITRFKGCCNAVSWCISHKQEIKKQRYYRKSIQKISDKMYIKQLSEVIFENIYFLSLPAYQRYLSKILNTLLKRYFALVRIK